MKKFFSWFGIISLTFTLGVLATLIWLKFDQPLPKVENNNDDLPILALCELINNPEKYNGQKIRLSADLAGNLHGYFLADRNCSSKEVDNKIVAVLFDRQNEDQIDQKLEAIRKSEPFDYGNVFRLIAVGKFRKVEKCKTCSDSMLDSTQLHFEIIEIEKGHLGKR